MRPITGWIIESGHNGGPFGIDRHHGPIMVFLTAEGANEKIREYLSITVDVEYRPKRVILSEE